MNRGHSRVKSLMYRLFITVVVLLGLGLLAYPSVSNWYNEAHRTRAIADYENVTASMSQMDLDVMFESARAYNTSLLTQVDRFRPSDAELENYNSILDITGTGIMGYIDIPAIDVRLPVYHTVDEAVLQIAAGHMPGTSFPIGEPGTHAVLSGHRGLPSAKLFTHLDKLQVDDVFQMHILDKTMTYRIYDIETVLPEELDSLSIQSDRDLITLVTCTPYGVNSHRLLVHAERTEDIVFDTSDASFDESVGVVQSGSSFDMRDDFGLILIGVFFVVLFVLFVVNKVKRKPEDKASGK